MNDEEQVKAVVQKWLEGLDSGDFDMMIDTCDPEVIVCNENQPTTIGIQAVIDKYAPRIENALFNSSFEVSYIKIYGDIAIVVGHFSVEMTDKLTGNKSEGKGRLILNYRKHPDGSWKMLLDVDNND